MLPSPDLLPARLATKVVVDAERGCWVWTAATDSHGYGVAWLAGRLVGAHRAFYELLVGSIPAGHELDHVECQRPACVNPDHVEPVTHAVNVERGRSPVGKPGMGGYRQRPAKTHCPAEHPYDEVNTYVDPSGRRHCRPCNRAAQRRRQKEPT